MCCSPAFPPAALKAWAYKIYQGLTDVMTSGRHPGGSVWWRILKPFFVLSVWGLEARMLGQQYHLSFTMPGMYVSTENRDYYFQALPPCVYPLSTWCNRMWPNLPGLPLCNCILQTIKYWRWKWPRNEAMAKEWRPMYLCRVECWFQLFVHSFLNRTFKQTRTPLPSA